MPYPISSIIYGYNKFISLPVEMGIFIVDEYNSNFLSIWITIFFVKGKFP